MTAHIEEVFLIDDFADAEQASNGARWQYISDRVMGGVSDGTAHHGPVGGRLALELCGTVSLDNNGGFIQIALDLNTAGAAMDAGRASGVAVCLCGDDGRYAINLRTTDTQRPWQSYRSQVDSTRDWKTHYLPFSGFQAHRIESPLNSHRLRRIGLIAIGDPGAARVAICRLALYRDVSP
ncbi:NADH:ubiquinone oxidoreductase complex i intermediate-associated protein 30 [gamma proteobacterium NOR5-3]|nr:NADH:ubiquinone oxidoreductase complex i intermediate-associated protein 30 [gamma proteobacterium NOR5-3]